MTSLADLINFTSSKKIGQIWIISVLIPIYTIAVPISIQKVSSLDVGNNSVVVYERLPLMPSDSVCRYKTRTYLAGDEVPTEEPCLRCQCKKQAVVCKLRVCTDVVPDAPPPGCIVVQKANSCCSKVVCPENKKFTREQRLSTETINTTVTGFPFVPGQGFCVHDGTIYAEGSAMKSSSACDYCFCIRGQMKCSQPQCVISLNGCKPQYRSFACCPTNYDCTQSNRSSIIQSKTATTLSPPFFVKGCRVRGRFIYDGEPVLPIDVEPNKENLCQTCFCFGGTIRCLPLECNVPLNGCLPITEDGHCCPSRYECPQYISNSTVLEKVEQNLLSLESATSKGVITDSVSSGTIDSSWTVASYDPSNASSLKVNLVDATTPFVPLSLDSGPESQILSNKIRLDIGSREERQNRDRDEMTSKTSYEDDERDYLFGVPSLEAIDHDLISKMAFERLSEPGRRFTVKALKSIQPTAGGKLDSKKSKSESGDENEIRETTTTGYGMTQSHKEFQNYFMTPFEHRANMTVQEEIPNSMTSTTSNGGEEIHQSTESEKKSNIFQLIPTTEMRLPNSTMDSTTSKSPPATIANLHFIPFSVEDALILPPISNNGTSHNSTTFSSQQITAVYDTVPDFSRSQLTRESEIKKDPVRIIQNTQNSYRNVIMDVPVSTSIYNNGYYQNGIITKSSQELNVSTFPGRVFDDNEGQTAKILQKPKEDDTQLKKNVDKKSTTTSVPFHPETFDQLSNPSRTYSKFDVHDSPSYRHHSSSKSGAVEHVSRQDGRIESFFDPHRRDYDGDLEPSYEDDDKTFDSFGELHSETNEFSKEILSSTVKVDEVSKPLKISLNSHEGENFTLHFPNYRHKEIPPTSGGSTHSPTVRPVVALPFRLNKPKDPFPNIGLKLSGCNIYGKMYKVGSMINELSGPCVQCQCAEIGVQCSQLC